MDLDTVEKLIDCQNKTTAALLALTEAISLALSREFDISDQAIRHQILDTFEQETDTETKALKSLRESDPDEAVLEQVLISNRALAETLFHFYIRLHAQVEGDPVEDAQEQLNLFRRHWVDHLSDSS
jgi:hypothetical protein